MSEKNSVKVVSEKEGDSRNRGESENEGTGKQLHDERKSPFKVRTTSQGISIATFLTAS
jgi:hypothetical protein